MQQSTTDPITAVCIVADGSKCPPNYELLLKSSDKRDDCDLWKDGVFKFKVTRYLCFSRTDQHKSVQKEVLVDLVIQNDKEIPPAGYRLIDKTIDTCEKATKKKQICVKMLLMSATTDAISDIILLSKSKQAPPGYTVAGDMNGLLLCFKMSKVTATGRGTPEPSSIKTGNENDEPKSTDTYAVNWWGVPVPYQPTAERAAGSSSGSWHYGGSSDCSSSFGSMPPPAVAQTSVSPAMKNATGSNPIFDIPFHLNPKFADEASLRNLQNVSKVSYKSLADIEKEYNYVFNLESSTISQARL